MNNLPNRRGALSAAGAPEYYTTALVSIAKAYAGGRLVDADGEAIRRVLVAAMMFANNTAAYNRGEDASYYEQEVDYYLGELKATVPFGGNSE